MALNNDDYEKFSRDIKKNRDHLRRIKFCLTKAGFHSLTQGSYLGFRNSVLASGVSLSGPREFSAFVLPMFDANEWVSLGTGKILIEHVETLDAKGACETIISLYRETIYPIRTNQDLIKYINNEGSLGWPWKWAKYLCQIYEGDYCAAQDGLSDADVRLFSDAVLERFSTISQLVRERDMARVRDVLRQWTNVSERLFGTTALQFTAF